MTEETPPPRVGEGRPRESEDSERGGYKPLLPEDGYTWKKYGQKFIRNIGKYRSYWRCQNENCRAKKRAEWSSTEPGELRVVYQGTHNHARAPSPASSDETGANHQYNLLTQLHSQRSHPQHPNTSEEAVNE